MLIDKYLPKTGQGDTMATQIATAVCRLVHKWYNDGDVYDNTGYMEGWCNDVSGCANWLARYVEGAREILDRIWDCACDEAYEDILNDIVDHCITEERLTDADKRPAVGDAYDEAGAYKFVERYDDDEEDW